MSPTALAHEGKRTRRILLPLGTVAVAILIAGALIGTRAPVEPDAAAVLLPVVEVTTVEPAPVQLKVRATGTVVPRTESDLVAEVSARVVWVSPAWASGGFFEEGAPLLRFEATDYDVALERARATLEVQRSRLSQAEKTLARNETLRRKGVASAEKLDDVRSAHRVAAAWVREAEAALRRAERDMARTELQAPFAGRVRQADVDVGQFVSRGAPIGRIYAVDYAEVELPVPDPDLAFLDLDLGRRGATADDLSGPPVTLSAEFAGRPHEWTGRVVRTRGEIDPKSRMVHVVVRVDDPYGVEAGSERPPLAVGLFVEAEIEGKTLPSAVVLPVEALRTDGSVLVLDEEDRLRVRRVEVVRRTPDTVVLGGGVAAGERVNTSALDVVVDGMRVRTAEGA